MYILLWIVFGGIIGWLASILTKNNRKMGIIMNIVVGLIGSAIGGFIADVTGLAPITVFSLWGALFALLGSVILLSLFNLIQGRKSA